MQSKLAVALIAISTFGAACGGGSGGGAGPAISQQPQSETVAVGATATFSVTATGGSPLTYQWRANGTAIADATATSYTTPAATAADNSTAFTVIVSDSDGSVTSASAVLTVAAPGSGPGTLTYHHRGYFGGDGAPFLAFQDGTGPWQTVTHVAGGDYTFTVSDAGGRYAIAVADPAYGASPTGLGTVFYGTLGEIADLTLPFAGAATPSQPSVQVVVAHMPDTYNAFVTLGLHSFVNFTATPAGGGTITSQILPEPVAHYEALLTLFHGPALAATPRSYGVFGTYEISGDGQQQVNVDAVVTYDPTDRSLSVTNAGASTPLTLGGAVALEGDTPGLGVETAQITTAADASGNATGTFAVATPPGGLTVLKVNTNSSPAVPGGQTALWASSSDPHSVALPAPLWLTDVSYAATTPEWRPRFTWTPTAGTLVYEYHLSGTPQSGTGTVTWVGDVTVGWAGGGASATVEWPDFTPVSDWAAITPQLSFADTGTSWTFSGAAFNGDVTQTLLAVRNVQNSQAQRKDGDLLTQQIAASSGAKLLCGNSCGAD